MRFGPGEQFAGYEIERVLARGGMGEVYVARHLVLDRRDAVKVLLPQFADDPTFRERFLREGKATASLSHPAVIPVHSAGEADGRLFLAMQFVSGQDLRRRLSSQGMPPRGETLRILGCVAGALDAADRVGLVHRDVKPGNILLAQQTPGRGDYSAVYLADFGICRHQGGHTLTPVGAFLGSIGYVAPEQILGHDLDGRTDQYSLACMAFEMLTGRTPFHADTTSAMVNAHLDREPPDASGMAPDLSPEVDRVFRRALAKDRTHRFPSSSAFVEALERAVLQEWVARAGDDTHPVVRPTSDETRPVVRGENGALPTPPSEPVGRPTIGVAAGPFGGLRFPMTSERLVLGRGEAADIRLPDAFLSRAHVAFGFGEAGELVVEDLASANGSLLDGLPLDGRRELEPRRLLQAGSGLFRRVDDAAAVARHLSRGDLPDALDVLPLARRPRSEVQEVRGSSPLHLRLGWQSLTGSPLSVRLADQPLGLVGSSTWTEPLVRWLLVQAAVLHDPVELGIVLALPHDAPSRWDWAERLPHASSGEGVVPDAGDVEAKLRAVSELVERRRAAGGTWHRRLLVVVGQGQLAAAAGVAERGVVVGVHVVAIGGRPHGAVQAEIDGRRGTLVLRRGDELTDGNPDGFALEAAEEVAAALAR